PRQGRVMADARIHRALADIPAAAWDALHDGRNPFIAHAFLDGMERHGVIDPRLGWTPWHLGLWEGDTLVAAAPGYLKTNSHGEFVFDHAWAQAYMQHGPGSRNGQGHSAKNGYYPKWLCAVPYSPVTGPRLLAHDDATKRRLLDTIAGFVEKSGLSSAHVNFHDDADEAAFGEGAPDERWLLREDIQYHWRNDAGWATFEGYLGAMDRKHRKNIRQERRKVQD